MASNPRRRVGQTRPQSQTRTEQVCITVFQILMKKIVPQKRGFLAHSGRFLRRAEI